MSVSGKTLYLENLTVSFDGFKALNELTLQVEPGELRCIIGPNGAGKTTMMDVITGKTRPDSGTVRFGPDLNLLSLSEPEIAHAGIGRKFQKPTVFEELTVFENLELALAGDKSFLITLFARRTAAQEQRIEEVLEIIGLTERREAQGKVLAHGQKQWLEIGMLLMQEPELLLVDEPVAGMTPQEIERTEELLQSLAGEHSVVVVEHDMDFVRSIAKRVTVLHEGRVIAEGDMDKVQNDPRVIEVYLGALRVLAIKALNQFYGGSHTLWDIDLSVPVGSRMCVMGRNGMGKTTLLKCIMGLLPASSGNVTFEGGELLKFPAEERARIGIGYVPQGREIFSHLTVEENLRVGLRVRKNGARSIPPRIFDLFPVLKKMLKRHGGDLSGGQQQQLAIGRALVLEPKLLILDEPTEGIQPNIVHEIGDIVLKLNKEEGMTVLLVEQKLPFARRVASDFCILANGRRVAAGAIGELTDEFVRAHLSV